MISIKIKIKKHFSASSDNIVRRNDTLPIGWNTGIDVKIVRLHEVRTVDDK